MSIKFLSLVFLLFAFSVSALDPPARAGGAKLISSEAPTAEFWLCQAERASGIAVRSLRIHEFKEKRLCLTLYTKGAEEKILIKSQWPASCQQALQKKKRELLSRFWSCDSLPFVSVFYPVSSQPLPESAPQPLY